MVEIRLLGPIEVIFDAEPVDVGGIKQRTVLAVLASRVGEWVSEDRLIHAVWGEDSPENALRSLQTYISNLRSLLDPDREGLIHRAHAAYRLNPELVDVDVEFFEETLNGSADRPVDELRSALDSWRGRPLAELADEEWASELVAHWERIRREGMGRLMEARLEEGEHAELIDELETLVNAHPLHEPFWGLLMLALYRSGRQAEALESYKRASRALGDELGIEPGAALQDLEEKILLQDPSLAAPTRTPNNLPSERTRLIGRESEIAEVLRLLESTRLLTLTGAGGVGKTRLAQAVGRELLDEYSDGVWFVDLAPLAEADLVMKRIAAVLDVEAPVLRPVEEVVVETIGNQRMLFVLDNCEHLIEAAANAAGSLLEPSSVRVLATSRETLRVDGELAWRVPSLQTPPEGAEPALVGSNEAVELFTLRARSVEPGFGIGAGNSDAVASLCRRLDGIPLAIELAAARISTLTPQELDQRLDECLALLTGGSRTALSRHRTLGASIDWSYQLLSPRERDLFNRLSVFAGPFDIDAVISVSPYGELETLDSVGSLVLKSMLIPQNHATQKRFRMLETLRDFGMERLRQRDLLVDSLDELLEWAHSSVAGLVPLSLVQPVRFARQIDADLNSIRSAMNWALESEQYDKGLLIASDLVEYWFLRALSVEGASWYDRFLGHSDSISVEPLARGLIASSAMLIRVGRWEEAFDQAQRALELLEDTEDRELIGVALLHAGIASYDLVELEESRRFVVDAQKSFEEAGDPLWTLNARAFEVPLIKDPQEALELANALCEQAAAFHAPVVIAHCIEFAGMAATRAGNLHQARERYREALPIWNENGVYACLAHCLDGVAVWLIECDRPEKGALVAAGTNELRRSLSTIPALGETYPELDRFKAKMASAHQEEVAAGRAMSRAQLFDFALEALRPSACPCQAAEAKPDLRE